MKREIEWLLGNDTGISSKAIFSTMTGIQYPSAYENWNWPRDAGDFGRCYRLLELFPRWKSRLREVSERFPHWAPIIEAWHELSRLYENNEHARLSARIAELERR